MHSKYENKVDNYSNLLLKCGYCLLFYEIYDFFKWIQEWNHCHKIDKIMILNEKMMNKTEKLRILSIKYTRTYRLKFRNTKIKVIRKK